jgi:hypothetical protein
MKWDMKEKGFNDRLSASVKAKQEMAAKFLKRPAEDDPAILERQAARAAVNAAREIRTAEREAKRLEDAKTAAEAAALAEVAAKERAAQDEVAAAERVLEEEKLEIERKAARDARYAARKARK